MKSKLAYNETKAKKMEFVVDYDNIDTKLDMNFIPGEPKIPILIKNRIKEVMEVVTKYFSRKLKVVPLTNKEENQSVKLENVTSCGYAIVSEKYRLVGVYGDMFYFITAAINPNKDLSVKRTNCYNDKVTLRPIAANLHININDPMGMSDDLALYINTIAHEMIH